eukprot:CAMPEP_0174368798 /NCGR_PEP_ID=MMETSP0811_2-20130205/90216_1 /TAXON_ID=73025 ORGANISM="Eutreptiella gymnastica-like, Strain CCMP1594" /NCGR_SAMPLE_ID=MMETSP0811_2 /ASSEMBLY_ACC=CAM_ASM_000667 /LENGTH=183 /DNA_ID=CAMNT_0015512597 /DNA_START=42 /DNA_END=590 /DNA_ORIENTATION=+
MALPADQRLPRFAPGAAGADRQTMPATAPVRRSASADGKGTELPAVIRRIPLKGLKVRLEKTLPEGVEGPINKSFVEFPPSLGKASAKVEAKQLKEHPNLMSRTYPVSMRQNVGQTVEAALFARTVQHADLGLNPRHCTALLDLVAAGKVSVGEYVKAFGPPATLQHDILAELGSIAESGKSA